jgi:hypothetical protein
VTQARISWKSPEHEVTINSADDLRAALHAAEDDATDGPVIVALEVGGASLMHVVGDPTGSTLVYFPPDYAETGYGSMHSVGDSAARAADESDPAQVAYMNGQHSEMPRWMVVPTSVAEEAIVSFMDSGGQLPDNIDWELD